MTKMKTASDERGVSRILGSIPWLRMGVFLLVCFGVVFPFTKTGKDAVRAMRKTRTVYKDKIVEVEVEGPTKIIYQERSAAGNASPTPPPKPTRIPVVAVNKDSDVRKLTKGMRLKYESNFIKGGRASKERKESDSYVATFTLDVKRPTAVSKLADIKRMNPYLLKMLPKMEQLMAKAKVSPFYKWLYDHKQDRLRKNVLNLDKLLTTHNYFDCETMLELTDPESKRKVFMMVADMDVVTDGSDGDRLAEMEEGIIRDVHYQPFTSYGWVKTSDTANPMIAGWKARIKNAEAELAAGGISSTRRSWLKGRIRMLKRGVGDMKRRSFLIAEHDPFIVISVDILTSNQANKFAPRVGDYVAVVYGNRVFPAIVGDGGPKFKAGEGSLRLAREINSRAGPNSRPVSSLSVTYLVFPGTAEDKKSAPDYALWHKKCASLIDEIGGLGHGYELHQWSDTLPQPEDTGAEVEVPAGTE